ncbi:crumpled leaf [Actinidia rufa]|uniref:Crumpled leaf n=1 Tax=Actinidia rufa TaxID=165716 RepID=A0A7J0GM90_9ERIC|nr:crumpled leaf [Actinidia rufa]
MNTGSDSDANPKGWSRARGVVLKTLLLIGGAVLLKRLTKSATRWDHSRIVAHSLTGQKALSFSFSLSLNYSKEQASRDPDNYFNFRWLSCPAAEMVDGSKVLYFEQRFFMVKPCPKEMKCDVELSTYAIRDAEGYKNFCDRSKDQRPQPEEVIGDLAEHLTTIYLKHCERGKPCLYEGSTPPDGFPNSWVWGVKGGPYEFKPAAASSFIDMFSPLNFPAQSMEKRIEGSFVIQD